MCLAASTKCQMPYPDKDIQKLMDPLTIDQEIPGMRSLLLIMSLYQHIRRNQYTKKKLFRPEQPREGIRSRNLGTLCAFWRHSSHPSQIQQENDRGSLA